MTRGKRDPAKGFFIEPGVRKTQDSEDERTCLDTQHVPGSGGGVYLAFPRDKEAGNLRAIVNDNKLNEDGI